MYGLAGVPLPFYNSTTLRLSLGLSPRVWSTVRRAADAQPRASVADAAAHPLSASQLREWKPDIVHVACPGMLVFAAQLYAYALSVPLVRLWRRFCAAGSLKPGALCLRLQLTAV